MTESTTTAPTRTDEQRLEALARANKVRTQRKEMKKDIKDGVTPVTAILHDPPDYVASMKVADLLRAAPKFGPAKASRLLNQCRIGQHKTVGGLSRRQRQELITMINTR